MNTYTPSAEEIEKLGLVRQVSLDWAAGDMRKASHMSKDFSGYMDQSKVQQIYDWYDGGAMVGAVILGMCAIQHAACFTPNLKDSEAFVKFVDTYLRTPYSGNELYSLRNSLIKQNTTRCYIVGQNGKEVTYMIMNNRPNFHLKRTKDVVILNLENFAKDVYQALDNFFDDAISGKLSKEVIDSIILHHDRHLLSGV